MKQRLGPALLTLAALGLVGPATAGAQAPPDTERVELSTGEVQSERVPEHTPQVVDESQWPDPTVTLLKSMVVPGWGQITNHRYVKAAFAIGLETWFITGTLVNNAKANDALDKYRETSYLPYYNEYQYYWGQRSDFMWLLGLTVFVSMFDAYVDAHLRPYESDTIPGVDPPKGVEVVFSF